MIERLRKNGLMIDRGNGMVEMVEDYEQYQQLKRQREEEHL